MRLNMSILLDCLQKRVTGCHISESAFLDLQNVRIYRPDRKAEWDRYVYLVQGETMLNSRMESWENAGAERHIIFVNQDTVPEKWAEEQWISIHTRSAVQDIFEELQSVFEWFQEWERRLLKAQLENQSIDKILEIASEALPNPVGLFDSSTRCLAWAGDLPEKRDALWNLVLGENIAYSSEMRQLYKKMNILTDVEAGKKAAIYRLKDEIWPDFLIANIYDSRGRVRMGNLGATPLNAPLTAGQTSIFEFLAEYMSPVMERDSKMRNDTRRQSLLNCLEGKEIIEEYFWAQLSPGRKGGHLQLRMLCLEENVQDGEEPWQPPVLAAKLQKHFDEERNIFTAYKNRVAVFTVGLDQKEKLDEWLDTLKKTAGQTRLRIGISRLFSSVSEAADCYGQAQIALRYAADTEGNAAVFFQDSFYRYAADKLTEKLSLKAVCHPGVYEIYTYDMEHHTEYRKTLQAYLEHGGNISKTAGALYLHRNTVLYRIEKIRELFGERLFEEPVGDLLFSLKLIP